MNKPVIKAKITTERGTFLCYKTLAETAHMREREYISQYDVFYDSGIEVELGVLGSFNDLSMAERFLSTFAQ